MLARLQVANRARQLLPRQDVAIPAAVAVPAVAIPAAVAVPAVAVPLAVAVKAVAVPGLIVRVRVVVRRRAVTANRAVTVRGAVTAGRAVTVGRAIKAIGEAVTFGGISGGRTAVAVPGRPVAAAR